MILEGFRPTPDARIVRIVRVYPTIRQCANRAAWYLACAKAAETEREHRAYMHLHVNACGQEWRAAHAPTKPYTYQVDFGVDCAVRF